MKDENEKPEQSFTATRYGWYKPTRKRLNLSCLLHNRKRVSLSFETYMATHSFFANGTSHHIQHEKA